LQREGSPGGRRRRRHCGGWRRDAVSAALAAAAAAGGGGGGRGRRGGGAALQRRQERGRPGQGAVRPAGRRGHRSPCGGEPQATQARHAPARLAADPDAWRTHCSPCACLRACSGRAWRSRRAGCAPRCTTRARASLPYNRVMAALALDGCPRPLATRVWPVFPPAGARQVPRVLPALARARRHSQRHYLPALDAAQARCGAHESLVSILLLQAPAAPPAAQLNEQASEEAKVQCQRLRDRRGVQVGAARGPRCEPMLGPALTQRAGRTPAVTARSMPTTRTAPRGPARRSARPQSPNQRRSRLRLWTRCTG
jgi:hypothetical protein